MKESDRCGGEETQSAQDSNPWTSHATPAINEDPERWLDWMFKQR